MDAKKHFWVDYLACLIFGAVIVPLWFFLENYPSFGMWETCLPMAVFAGIHAVCFVGLKLLLKGKEERVSFFYLLWSVFWFSVPIGTKYFLPLLGRFYRFRWFCALLVFLISFVAFLILLKRLGRIFSCINRVVGIAVYVLLTMVLLHVFWKVFCYRDGGFVMTSDINRVRPNIYHILLDAHPNQKGFERVGGDLTPFYRKLEEFGFITYPESKSVFPFTERSVSAMWFMDAEVHDSVKDSVLSKVLAGTYAVRMYLSWEGLSSIYGGKGSVKCDDFIGAFYCFTYKTVFRLIFEQIFYERVSAYQRARHRAVLTALERGKDMYGVAGNFFYGHILSPHPPFVYVEGLRDFRGFFQEDQGIIPSNPEYFSDMRDNVYGIGNLVLNTIKAILNQYENVSIKPIIILHSDHGFRTALDEDGIYGNLFAIYMPDEWKKDAKDLKFINLYRFIFNHLVGTNYEYLPEVRKNLDGSIFKEKTLPSSDQ